MFYKNNWLIWQYDNIPYSAKTNPESEFKLTLQKTVVTVKDYLWELLENAKNIRDLINGPLDLLFSGGIDSEVVLRTYKQLNIPINVYIFKYLDQLNYREFDHALEVCKSLNVQYKVIDFDVKKFFEQDAYNIWTKCYCDNSSWLPHMKLTEYLDNTPIFGSGEPYWRLQSDGKWALEIDEDAKYWTTYHINIGRSAVTDWYEYRPEIILSHMQLPIIQSLINGKLPGKLSSFSSKSPVHKNFWSDIKIRPKMVGFEGDGEITANNKPEYMLEFEKKYTSTIKRTTYRWYQHEIIDALYFF